MKLPIAWKCADGRAFDLVEDKGCTSCAFFLPYEPESLHGRSLRTCQIKNHIHRYDAAAECLNADNGNVSRLCWKERTTEIGEAGDRHDAFGLAAAEESCPTAKPDCGEAGHPDACGNASCSRFAPTVAPTVAPGVVTLRDRFALSVFSTAFATFIDHEQAWRACYRSADIALRVRKEESAE